MVSGSGETFICNIHDRLDEPGVTGLKYSEGTLIAGTFPIISTEFDFIRTVPN